MTEPLQRFVYVIDTRGREVVDPSVIAYMVSVLPSGTIVTNVTAHITGDAECICQIANSFVGAEREGP